MVRVGIMRDVMVGETHDTRPLPDHCENIPTQAAISVRRLLPGVCNSSTQRLLEPSISARTVAWISANSAATKALSLSLSPWYSTRMLNASSLRSRDTSHRGDSGMNQMNVSWSKDGAICSRDGILHAQSFGMENVPRVTPAAMIAPTYQLSLKRPLSTAVWRG